MNFKNLIAIIISVLSFSVSANNCEITIDANDSMQFTKKELTVTPSKCKEVTLKLVHIGKLPTQTMGHNWVLTKTSDYQSVAIVGMSATLANNYVPKDDSRVIANTKVIGGGEQTSITFASTILKVGEDYTFFCSFPGHFSVMKGKLIVN